MLLYHVTLFASSRLEFLFQRTESIFFSIKKIKKKTKNKKKTSVWLFSNCVSFGLISASSPLSFSKPAIPRWVVTESVCLSACLCIYAVLFVLQIWVHQWTVSYKLDQCPQRQPQQNTPYVCCGFLFFLFWLFVSRSILSLWGIYVVFSSPPPLFFEPPFFVFVCHIETAMSIIFHSLLASFYLVVWNVNLRIAQIKRSNKYGNEAIGPIWPSFVQPKC